MSERVAGLWQQVPAPNFVIDNIDTQQGIKKQSQRVMEWNCVILGQIINKIFDLDLISLYMCYQRIIIHREGESFFWIE